MQLDGYNQPLAIAFEYQEPQHYQPFGRYTADFVAKQQQRDELKARLCHTHGVRLIVVRYFKHDWNRAECQQAVELAVMHAGLGEWLK